MRLAGCINVGFVKSDFSISAKGNTVRPISAFVFGRVNGHFLCSRLLHHIHELASGLSGPHLLIGASVGAVPNAIIALNLGAEPPILDLVTEIQVMSTKQVKEMD